MSARGLDTLEDPGAHTCSQAEEVATHSSICHLAGSDQTLLHVCGNRGPGPVAVISRSFSSWTSKMPSVGPAQ